MQLSKFKSDLSLSHKMLRLVWGFCWLVLFRPSPRVCHGWRRFLLRMFGAKIGKGVRIYNSAIVYYPPNLALGDHAVIAPHVDIYCVAPITISEHVMVSQYSYLCAASHDYTKSHLPLIASPIFVGPRSWICARAFIGPGVTIGSNALVAACAVVIKGVEDGQIVGGNPARFIKTRPLATE